MCQAAERIQSRLPRRQKIHFLEEQHCASYHMFGSETANGSLLQQILALICKPRAFLTIKHEVIKATGRIVAVHKNWYRAKEANGEVTRNINDSSWFVCLCQPMDQEPGAADIKQPEDTKTRIFM